MRLVTVTLALAAAALLPADAHARDPVIPH